MISVIICTYNRAQCLPAALNSLAAMTVPPSREWELVVVDNNSSDSTRKVVGEFARRSGLAVTYVFEPVQGLSQARNSGIAHARGEILAFADDDAVVSPSWLEEIARAFETLPCIGVGGRCIPEWNGVERPCWLVTTGPYRVGTGVLLDFDLGSQIKPTRVPPWGLNMAFRRVAFERYGGFRTDLGVAAGRSLVGEDTEFGKRLVRAGETLYYLPAAVVRHPVQAQRLTKRHFMTRSFNEGRTEMREAGWPPGSILYRGIPRYVFRKMAGHALRSCFSPRPQQRFFYRLLFFNALGQAAEARRMRTPPAGDAPAPRRRLA